MEVTLMLSIDWKEKSAYSMIPTIWHSGKGNNGVCKEIRGYQRFQGGEKEVGMNRQSTENFLGQWIYFVWYSNSEMHDTKHLSKPSELYKTEWHYM